MTQPESPRILRLPAVIEKTGLGRDSLYRGAREGWFPRPIKLSERASGWLESEVNDFIANRAAAREARTA